MLVRSDVWFFVAPVGWAMYDLFAFYVRQRIAYGDITPNCCFYILIDDFSN
jgi:hypothetical protein